MVNIGRCTVSGQYDDVKAAIKQTMLDAATEPGERDSLEQHFESFGPTTDAEQQALEERIGATDEPEFVDEPEAPEVVMVDMAAAKADLLAQLVTLIERSAIINKVAPLVYLGNHVQAVWQKYGALNVSFGIGKPALKVYASEATIDTYDYEDQVEAQSRRFGHTPSESWERGGDYGKINRCERCYEFMCIPPENGPAYGPAATTYCRANADL